MRILAIGVATLDIVNYLASFPVENSEQRVLRQTRVCGGNAANMLFVLSQMGHTCSWGGILGDDDESSFLQRELKSRGIAIASLVTEPGGRSPVSCILVSEENGSRTIVHHRDLPEYLASDFEKIDVDRFDWIHFEGRDAVQTTRMLRELKRRCPRIRCSLEVEKPRPGIEETFDLPDVIMFSRDYAQARGFSQPKSFLGSVRNSSHARLFLAWGELGGYAMEAGEVHASPAFHPETLVDTLGAGDAFNAAIIDAMLRADTTPHALSYACRIAGLKCGRSGLHGLFNETGGDVTKGS